MKKRFCLITDLLSPPFDEGMKIFALQLSEYMAKHCEFLGLTNDRRVNSGGVKFVKFGRGLMSTQVRRAIHQFSPHCVIYIPQASITNSSFARVFLLRKSLPQAKLAMIGLQPRTLSRWGQWFARNARPLDLLVQSNESIIYLESLGIAARWIPSIVDTSRFRPATRSEKDRIRRKYGIAKDIFLVLHVGHMKESRNLHLLKRIQEVPGIQCLVVVSTSTKTNSRLKEQLLDARILVLDRFIEQIQEVYQMADCYVFPVVNPKGAIEIPLSILESMSCGIPVLTNPFGGLRDIWREESGLFFIQDQNRIDQDLQMIRDMHNIRDSARALVKNYDCATVFEQLIQSLADE